MPSGKKEIASEIPDTVRRRDQPQVDAPGTVPRPDEETRIKGSSPPEDGGAEDHPIHDDDLEDMQPDDYEDMIDKVGRGGFESVDLPRRRKS